MDISNCYSCTTGGSINIMTHVKGHKKPTPKFKKLTKREVGEVEAIQAATETRARFGGAKGKGRSAKEALERKKKLDTAEKKGETPREEIQPTGEAGDEQGILSKGLDLLSAPLSQPGETFTKGISAGAEAVRESRGIIAGGIGEAEEGMRSAEATRVALVTLGSTTVAAGVILAAGWAWQAASASIATKAAIKLGNIQYSNVYKLATPTTRIGIAGAATNIKTLGLTSKILIGVGATSGAASLTMAIWGTYPFATFVGKEEAIQTMSFPIKSAIDVGRFDVAESLINDVESLITANKTIGDFIPVQNVLNGLEDFTNAANSSIAAWKEIIEEKRKIVAGERLTQFDIEREAFEE